MTCLQLAPLTDELEPAYLVADLYRTPDNVSCILVNIVDADGAAFYSEQGLGIYLDLDEDWIGHLGEEVGVATQRALDGYCQMLMSEGWKRADAIDARNGVRNPTNLPVNEWPCWECMTVEQQHRAHCIVMDVSDPLA
jgi:hypothetical protein